MYVEVFKIIDVYVRNEQYLLIENEFINNYSKRYKPTTKIEVIRKWSKFNQHEYICKHIESLEEKELLERFVNLNLIQTEAAENASKILSSFIRHQNLLAKVSSKHDFIDRMLLDWQGDESLDHFPYGKSFWLKFLNEKPRQKILDYFHPAQTSSFNLFIDLDRLSEIVGVFGVSIALKFDYQILELNWWNGSDYGSFHVFPPDYDYNAVKFSSFRDLLWHKGVVK